MTLNKLQTKTTLDPSEIDISLRVVPRVVLTFLVQNLKPMTIGEVKEFKFPFCDGYMNVNKLSQDVYSGQIHTNQHKKVYDFQFRSIPGLGLVIMTTFELYNLEESIPKETKSDDIQSIIDERLKFHSLVGDVVDRKIKEREAINQLILDKIKDKITVDDKEEKKEEIKPIEEVVDMPINKSLKLKDFLEKKHKKIDCPICKNTIYKGGDRVRCCICYGQFYKKEIEFKIVDGKIKFDFPNGFDKDNVEILLEAVKRK